MTIPTLLSVEGLGCRFGGLTAVDGLTMKVPFGEIRALIGPNGAGKSTTLNLITGIYRPTAGAIHLNERSLTGVQDRSLVGLAPSAIARAGIARTFQTIRLWKRMTLLENVMVGHQCRTRAGFFEILFATRRSRLEEVATRDKAFEVLALVGLADKAHALAGSLSYGQQRRLEIARALATEPRVLLLDEPAAGMNPQEVADLGDQILTIRKSGITVVLIEHNMPFVMRIADQITVLSFGKKIAEGTPAEIRANPDVIAAYLGKPDDDVAA